MQRVLVTGAGGFIGHHLVTYLKERGLLGPRRRPQATRSSPTSTPTSSSCSTSGAETTPSCAVRGVDRGLRAGGRHGRHGLHLEQPRRRSCTTTPSSTSTRSRPPGCTASSGTCTAPRRASTRSTCRSRRRRHAAARGGRLPGEAPGRLRLGEADLGAPLRVLHGRARHGDAHRPLPQRLRTLRDVRRRPREGAGGAVPQGRAGASPAARSRSGETASRRAPSATSTTASRASTESCNRDYARAAQPRAPTAWSPSTSSPTSSSPSPASTTCELVHVEGPQGVRGRNSDNSRLREVLGWEPEISLEDGLAPTYRWIEEQVERSAEKASERELLFPA